MRDGWMWEVLEISNGMIFIAPEESFVVSRSGDRTAKIIHQQQMRLPGMISFPEQFFRYSRKSIYE